MNDKIKQLYQECKQTRDRLEIRRRHIDMENETEYNNFLIELSYNNGQMSIIREFME